MNTFKYGDEWIKPHNIFILVPSITISVGILSYIRILSRATETIDGWVAIVGVGIVTMIIAWLVAKLASLYPQQSFLDYASTLVSKPIATILTLLYTIFGLLMTAYEVRMIGVISEQYLFTRTPLEVITLSFLLVVVYAVSGIRAGIFRLNSMFLPLTIIAIIVTSFFSVRFMEWRNILPLFKTDMQGYMEGIEHSTIIYAGMGLLFFYIGYVKNEKQVPKMAVLGVGFVILIYLLTFITCIAVFGPATGVIRLPIIELAKAIELPGGVFERLESVFFVIWVMIIFISCIIVFDVAVLSITLILKKIKKTTVVFVLSPIVYLISTVPKDYVEVETFGRYISYYEVGLTTFVLFLLWTMHLIKGGKNRAK